MLEESKTLMQSFCIDLQGFFLSDIIENLVERYIFMYYLWKVLLNLLMNVCHPRSFIEKFNQISKITCLTFIDKIIWVLGLRVWTSCFTLLNIASNFA